ncbi:MAG TPA: KpsF/GutQ family sugar-phosphate isomerase [Alphaproteobacteria bacterium]|jgi:arabinose-5-phosphate isomerase|nr:KpsF/GutQ family sugar-phosphate isomerase [Alphaproteobacteria bacterium]HBC52780.1 KpsF/GutQ family sugar-phosphate isomerase [Alphaproteobacteria bacterium]HBF99796.1 KpsF/GutQ family sugar-phosphate isomerase [Alphaproteobacteria bacterium]HCO89932.1 KpsF/GutQ family sugar-phosphate isomerase [Alphaproteobacteria bacterium]
MSSDKTITSGATSGAHPVDAPEIAAGRRVLTTAAQALQSMAQSLDGEFTRAVDILCAVHGRVIVSGMGKSGHIARKLAATLASTGTPAQFIHPGEASHGDLGMITPADACLMLSNSGETPELNDLIAHTRRYKIPLIGVARHPESTLLRSADVALVLPPAPEACPMGKAPTTSTTVTLSLGDALAVAVMERKGFSIDDYRLLHPGGQIGKSLLRVRDLMHLDNLPLVGPDADMREVLLVMTSGRFGCAGVVNAEAALIGIITDGDLRRHMTDGGLLSLRAEDVMTANPKTIHESALAAEALGLMAGKITCLFVSKDNSGNGTRAKPVGILHIHDCLRAGVA